MLNNNQSGNTNHSLVILHATLNVCGKSAADFARQRTTDRSFFFLFFFLWFFGIFLLFSFLLLFAFATHPLKTSATQFRWRQQQQQIQLLQQQEQRKETTTTTTTASN